MRTALALLACIGAGTVGGIFFAFSNFVMQALGRLPDAHGAAAMQTINVTVLNPLFLGVFMGTAVLGAGSAIAAFLPWSGAASALLLAAGLLYLGGTFLVTLVFNVPRNKALAGLAPESPQAGRYWRIYLREWVLWNHVRTAASLASAACSAAALGF